MHTAVRIFPLCIIPAACKDTDDENEDLTTRTGENGKALKNLRMMSGFCWDRDEVYHDDDREYEHFGC